jgi:Holliday junction resolvase
MGAKSRNKGAAFEREVAGLLDLHLGWKVKRNLEQYQVKGLGDLNGKPGVMIECKRYATATDAQIGMWWAESLEQAKTLPETAPVLIFKADRQPIKAVVPWGLVYADASDPMADAPITLAMDQFYELARELL